MKKVKIGNRHHFVNVFAAEEIERQRVEIELLTKSRDSFREACHRYSNGPLEAG